MRRVVALLAAVLAAAAITSCGGGGAEPGAPQGASLVLDFTPNAAHSGIYAARAQGFYRDAGVELDVQQPGDSTDAPKLLEAGRTDFAILDIEDLGIARERGLDLVGVAPIVSAPLASVIAPADGPVARPRGPRRAKRRGDRPALRRRRPRLGRRRRRRRPGAGGPGDDRLQRGRLAGRGEGGRRHRLPQCRGGDPAPPGSPGPGLQGGQDFGAPRFPELVLCTSEEDPESPARGWCGASSPRPTAATASSSLIRVSAWPTCSPPSPGLDRGDQLAQLRVLLPALPPVGASSREPRRLGRVGPAPRDTRAPARRLRRLPGSVALIGEQALGERGKLPRHPRTRHDEVDPRLLGPLAGLDVDDASRSPGRGSRSPATASASTASRSQTSRSTSASAGSEGRR